MANTLGIQERTMAQVVDSTNSINLVGATRTRKSVYQPIVVRITDHDRDNGGTGNDADNMAIFVSTRHGEPWKCDVGLEHVISNGDASLTNATVIYPDFDYTEFE